MRARPAYDLHNKIQPPPMRRPKQQAAEGFTMTKRIATVRKSIGSGAFPLVGTAIAATILTLASQISI